MHENLAHSVHLNIKIIYYLYIKLIFKKTINNKQKYSPRLYKYRDSYVLYIPSVHANGSVNFTYTFLVQTYT